MHTLFFDHDLLYYAWNRICLVIARELTISGPQNLKWIYVIISLDGLASMTSEPHMYTAAVSLVRNPVGLFAALA